MRYNFHYHCKRVAQSRTTKSCKDRLCFPCLITNHARLQRILTQSNEYWILCSTEEKKYNKIMGKKPTRGTTGKKWAPSISRSMLLPRVLSARACNFEYRIIRLFFCPFGQKLRSPNNSAFRKNSANFQITQLIFCRKFRFSYLKINVWQIFFKNSAPWIKKLSSKISITQLFGFFMSTGKEN